MKIYIYDISSLEEEDIERYYNSLPKWRREKIDKYTILEDKLRCLGASLLLEYAFRELGIDVSECSILTGENGKPYIEGREDLHFNISHSGTKVVIGIGENALGVDIQQVRLVNLRLVDRFYTIEEGKYVDNEMERFHEIWCLKESYLKCIGTGLTKDIKSIEIIPGQKMSIDDYELHLKNIDGYKLGICTLKNTNIEIINLNKINQ